MNDHGRIIVNKIGLGLSLGLWVLSSWRWIFHTICRRRRDAFEASSRDEAIIRRRGSTSQSYYCYSSITQLFTRRRTFHCLLWMATTCEALAYADRLGIIRFSDNRIFADKLGYVLLEVAGRSILELLALAMVTAIWLHTAIDSSSSSSSWSGGVARSSSGSSTLCGGVLLLLVVPSVFLVVMVLLVLASAACSVMTLILCQDEASMETTQKTLPWICAQRLLEAMAWGVHSLVVLGCLIVTSKRVLVLVPPSSFRTGQRLTLLTKAVLPMLVATFVYAIRCGWLIAMVVVPHDDDINSTSRLERGTWAWWIGFCWTPTCLAAGVLLYSARKRDPFLVLATATTRMATTIATTDQNDLEQPLLLSLPARPPAEAFLAFSQHRHGLDVDDSFSFCRSPIRHLVLTPCPVDDVNHQDDDDDDNDEDEDETTTPPSSDS